MRALVFVGLPGSGKTTISKLVAHALNRPWFDSDAEIESGEGMSIPEVFALHGEEYFRRLETGCIQKLVTQHDAVIAVGGGAVLHNAALLERESDVVFIDRSVEDILSTLEPGTRPLLKDPQKLYAIKQQRDAIYRKMCKFSVVNDGTVHEAVEKVLKLIG